MSSLSIKIPLTFDPSDGFATIKNFNDLAKQHLKMLILTHPGERIMEPTYGVGARAYLFGNSNDETMVELQAKIKEQVSVYIPGITLRNVSVSDRDIDNNKISIKISYTIPELGFSDFVSVTI